MHRLAAQFLTRNVFSQIEPLLRAKNTNASGSGATPSIFRGLGGGAGAGGGILRSLAAPFLSLGQQRRIINSCNCVPAAACLRVKPPSIRELFTGGRSRSCPQPGVSPETSSISQKNVFL